MTGAWHGVWMTNLSNRRSTNINTMPHDPESEPEANAPQDGPRVQDAQPGDRVLLSGVALRDPPEPGSGHLLAWATFPGDGKVEVSGMHAANIPS